MIASHGQNIGPPVGKRQWHGNIIGRPLVFMLLHHRKTVLEMRIVQFLTHPAQPLGYIVERAVEKGRTVVDFMRWGVGGDLIAGFLPDVVLAGDLRMQRPDHDAETRHRHAVFHQLVGQGQRKIFGGFQFRRATQQPVDHRAGNIAVVAVIQRVVTHINGHTRAGHEPDMPLDPLAFRQRVVIAPDSV